MKCSNKLKSLLTVAVFTVGAFQAAPAKAASISLSNPAIVTLGSTFAVDINVALGPTEAVGGVSLDLGFLSSILSGDFSGTHLLGYTPDPDGHMATGAAGGINDYSLGFTSGNVDLVFLPDALYPTFADLKTTLGQGLGFTLARVFFTASGPGVTALTLFPIGLGPAYISNESGRALVVTSAQAGSVCVVDPQSTLPIDQQCRGGQTPVPEPGTLSLLGLGFAGLAAAARRRARA